MIFRWGWLVPGTDSIIALGWPIRFKQVTCLVYERQFQLRYFPSSSHHQIEQIPRKTFSRLLPISPPPSDLSRLIHPVASIVSLFKAGGILSPHLWTRHYIRKCLLLCLNFANCSIKPSLNRGQIYSNKKWFVIATSGELALKWFLNKARPF